ncbi:hypothetical protein BGZ83_008470 [Gryganskiella cystojenkinii]|nr:hypothetical protein BGZ83_008470 [Gryganskiella cystojenkinii]
MGASGVSTASTSSRPARNGGGGSGSNNNNGNDFLDDQEDIDTPSQHQRSNGNNAAGSSSSQAPTAAEPELIFPPSIVTTLKPSITAFAPHMDLFKAGLQYITEATLEYEEFHGARNNKGTGAKEPTAKSVAKKPTSRAKAAQQAYADQQAFSQDPQIHAMENALNELMEMQRQAECERQALDTLANRIGAGARLPSQQGLKESFDILLNDEIKHEQTRRKQDQKASLVPGGIERELYSFRTKVWEVHHQHDPLPTSASIPGGGDEDEDDDMEIVETGAGSVQNLKCPITTNFLEDPVTSSVCKHSFSKEAILALIRNSGGRGQIPCPSHGCNNHVSAQMLQPNKALARKVARQKMIQEEIGEHEEEEYTTVDD